RGRSGKPQGRRQVWMPDAYPQPFGRATRVRQGDAFGDPGVWILDPRILAEGAVHPDDGRLLQIERALPRSIPRRNHVADAETEPVPVGKSPRRVVAKPRFGHAEHGLPGP